jgi:hypothetical protein
MDMRMLKNYFDKEPRVLYITTCSRNYCILNIVLIFIRRGPCPWKKKLYVLACRSQWPRGLRRGSAGPRLLRLRVRIPPEAWMFVCYECCVLSGRCLCDQPIAFPEDSHRVCVCVCVSLSVIGCNSSPVHLHWLGRRGHTKNGRKNK